MEINAGDTAWILISTALVLVMTPALAFFYGGMVRQKNILSTLNLSFITMGVISIQWILIGYSLAFGNNIAGIVGGLNHIGLNGVSAEPGAYADNLPGYLFVAFQMTFAIITPALITGAFVERVRFKSYLLFIVLWATFVYDPLCHWVWGSGGIFTSDGIFGGGMLGAGVTHALDFAGGTVVHISAGMSALAFALVIKSRHGYGERHFEPHNIPYVVLGAGLLWMGWFGFNGGSALAADGLAATALLNTNTAAAAAMVVWMILAWSDDKPGVMGMVTGAVCGLVAITPAAGFVSPMSALVIGAIAAPVSFYTIKIVESRGVDESLDVFACHGMSGIWGALATGIFATESVGGVNGLLFGNPGQFVAQLISVVAAAVFAFVLTYIIAQIINGMWGLRVSPEEEEAGLDISEHGERAYAAS